MKTITMTRNEPVLVALASLVLCAVTSACASANAPANGTHAATVDAEDLERSLADSPPATEEAQVAMGAHLFDRNCDACHGQSGQGNVNNAAVGVYDGPQVIGRETLVEDLNHGSGYANAAQLHDFVAHHLPDVNRRHLSQTEYWAVTAYMLYESGQPLQQRVDEDSAAHIMIGSDNLVASSELR